MRFLRSLQPFLWVASAVAVAYCAWVLTGRLLDRRVLEERVIRKAMPPNPQFEARYLGNTLQILQFYAREGELAAGLATRLCYGTVNAAVVTMDPVVEGVRPSLSHCVEIAPGQTTTYTLTAESAAGAKVSKSVTVVVNPR